MKLLIRLFTNLALVAFVSGCAVTSFDKRLCQEEVSVTQVPALDLAGLDDVPGSNRARAARVLRMLGEACERIETQDVRRSYNVTCVIKGKTDNTIVVGAHHDKTGTGRGIADNWTGVIMLTQLARHLQQLQRQDQLVHTWHLVAFAEEEGGLYGSKRYVRNARQDEALPRYMINLDAVGIDRLHIDPRSNSSLMCPVIATAGALDVDIEVVSISETTGDWEPFSRAGVEVLNLHSLTRKSIDYLHTYRDTRNLIDDRRLEESYQVIVNLLRYLDKAAPG